MLQIMSNILQLFGNVILRIIPSYLENNLGFFSPMKTILLILILNFICEYTLSQSTQIYGRVIDITTKEAVSYANICTKKQIFGTISNIEGYFVLKLNGETEKDSILISHISYETKKISVNDLKKDSVIIKLTPSVLILNTIEIRPPNPKKLIIEAIEKISENYPVDTICNEAFYREILSEGDEIFYFAEASINVLKTSYNSVNKDKIQILKTRKIVTSKEPKLNLFWGNGIYNSLKSDLVKNKELILNPKYIDNHTFVFKGKKYINENETYIIDFSPLRNYGRGYYGTIGIDVKSMAFAFIICSLNNNINKLVYTPSVGGGKKILKSNVKVYYNNIDGIWQLQFCSIEGSIKYKAVFEEYNGTVELLFGKQISSYNINQFHNSQEVDFENIKAENYNPNFWYNRTYILPSDSVLNRLKKR